MYHRLIARLFVDINRHDNMYNPTYDTGVRNVRTYDVIPLNDTLQQRRDINMSNNQLGYVYGDNTTNGRPREPRGANNTMTSYDVKQTNYRPQVFGGTTKTGERICQYGNTNRTIDISENASHTKSSHGITTTTSNQQLHPQRSWMSARGIRRSSLSGQGRGTSFEGLTLPGNAKLKQSETVKSTTEPTPERTQQRKTLKRPSVVVTESTYLNLAVVVTVFFNIPIGLLAVAVAMRSATAYRSHRVQQGRRYATLALVVSLLGVVTTVAAVMAAVQYVTTKTDDLT